MSKKHGYSPNDQRSVVKNPNNPAHWIDRQNRIEQGHRIPETVEPPVSNPSADVERTGGTSRDVR